MDVYELNMDGLVGPTHHYAGLSTGNVASIQNALTVANPKAAALQGLAKMRLLHHLGLKQALMPPHPRPNLTLLHQLGFGGTPAQQVHRAKQTDPNLLSACYSASSMWAANMATITPSIDSKDNRVHFTAANLVGNLHRHQETDFSHYLLTVAFSNKQRFAHHTPLPKTLITSDEGAANHNRLSASHNDPGLHLFVYGKKALPPNDLYPGPRRFPARQTLEASMAIARLHELDPSRVVFAAQNPEAIDQGVFHNDVIAVANESILFLHENAFLNQQKVYALLNQYSNASLNIIEVAHSQLSMEDVVQSYLFNSQLVTLPSTTKQKHMALIAPIECKHNTRIRSYIEDELIASNKNPIVSVHYLDLKQSMKNGGGPACLRIRIPLTTDELSSMHQGILVHDDLLDNLEQWITRHYRSSLHANDLDDPELINECFTALDELTHLLKLGSIYPFQKNSSA